MHLPLSRGGRGSMAETQYAFLGPEASSSSEAKVKAVPRILKSDYKCHAGEVPV